MLWRLDRKRNISKIIWQDVITMEIGNDIQFNTIERANFNRDKNYKGSMEIGLIYPIESKICLPSDQINIKLGAFIRQQPTLAPSLSQHKLKIRAFFTPLRVLDKNFYSWLSGYKEYSTRTKYEDDLPRWRPSSPKKTGPKSLWSSFGLPIDCIPTDNCLPIDHHRRNYGYVIDTFFRYEPVEESLLEDGEPGSWKGEDMYRVMYDRDYFTTTLPFQQLGDPISIPIIGDSSVEFNFPTESTYKDQVTGEKLWGIGKTSDNKSSGWIQKGGGYGNNNQAPHVGDIKIGEVAGVNQLAQYLTITNEHGDLRKEVTVGLGLNAEQYERYKNLLKDNKMKGQTLSSATIDLIRKSFAYQQMAEINAKGGILPNELMLSHFGEAPSDETLGRPIYLGGAEISIQTSEVLQTSSTTGSQVLGEMAGHGLGVGADGNINYKCKEFGILLIVAYIKYETSYMSQGIDAEMRLSTRFDIPFPSLQHLSEQPVLKSEILCASSKKINKKYEIIGEDETAEAYNEDVFGYRSIFDAWRTNKDITVGLLAVQQFYKDGESEEIEMVYNKYNWTEARYFDIRKGKRPALNSDFLKVKSDNRNYTILDNSNMEYDQFIVEIKMKQNWNRPISKLGIPASII